ncbi:MAG: hypothetical protein GKR87_14895 [Kiritimatiellae bacterium]|nr:hypothetical protein [Kiritimatiellia bacterium]
MRRKENTSQEVSEAAYDVDNERDIAIIGMACRFPGAHDYQSFWKNLRGGVNSICEIPEDRWDWRNYYGDPQRERNKTNSKWGGFVEGIDTFDASFFNISRVEAESMDPRSSGSCSS